MFEKYGKVLIRELVSPYGNVNDKMMEVFEKTAGLNIIEIGKIVKNTFDNLSNPAEYRDDNGELCKREDATYIWIHTGVPDNYSKETLYIGLVKNNHEYRDIYTPEYVCYFIASKRRLEDNLKKYAVESVKKEEKEEEILSDIYNMLLIKSNWGVLPGYRVLSELLRISEAKILNDAKYGEEYKNCIYNKDHTKIAYNTGLISTYANDIIIIADINSEGSVVSRKIAQSKTHLKQEGFELVDIIPVSFYESRKDLIFQATADDFDLDDIERIRHIIEHRKERFPEEAKILTDDELYNKIRSSLEFDLKMTARNPYWAAPFYNVKQNEIQHLLPLFTGSLSEAPSLAMVIGKGEHYYEVRTVLPLKMAYANAACLASPPSAWLNPTKETTN